MRAKFARVILLSALIMQLGFGAVNGAGYVAKLNDTITPSSTVIGINKTAGLELTMQVQKTTYSQGEPVSIMLSLTNISNVTLSFWMTAWTFDFQVFNDTNHHIFQYSTSKVFPQVIWNVSIKPGNNLTELLVWPQTCNTTEGVLVSPGTYYIVGQIWNIGSIILRTPPLQITVVKPARLAIARRWCLYHCYVN